MNQWHQFFSELELVSRKYPIVAPSWLSKPLIGESQCLLQYYVQVHYKLSPNRSFVSYQIEHQSFLMERKQFWRAEGCSVSADKVNKISFVTKRGPQFIGNPDLYVKELNHFEELKTGNPKDSDVIQLMLYMAAAPYVYRLQEIPSGEVRYSDGSCIAVLPEDITQKFKDRVTQLIGIFVADQIPEPEPSESDCRFCKFNQYCPVSEINDIA